MQDAYELLTEWASEDRMALAYPCIIDGKQTIVAVALDLEPASRCLAVMPDEHIRALFTVYVMTELKRRARLQAEKAGLHVEI